MKIILKISSLNYTFFYIKIMIFRNFIQYYCLTKNIYILYTYISFTEKIYKFARFSLIFFLATFQKSKTNFLIARCSEFFSHSKLI